MPAPTHGARFDLSTMPSGFTLDGIHYTSQQDFWMTEAGDAIPVAFQARAGLGRRMAVTMTNSGRIQHNELLFMLRDAGVWFADIARILNYPTASSASAAYIRECRRRGAEPRVRATAHRAIRTGRAGDWNLAEIPSYCDRMADDAEDFTFGVELETERLGIRNAAHVVGNIPNYPLSVLDNGYTHGATHTWKVVPDGSLGSSGAEVVSRVLRGRNGFAEMRAVMLSLKAAGASSGSSRCGAHIHIGVEHLSDAGRAAIIRWYNMFQPVFDLLIKPRRRNSQYASHARMSQALQSAASFGEGNTTLTYGRYRTLNLESYTRYGTFEFRAMQGTLNPRHHSAWIQLHMDFISFLMDLIRRFGMNPLDQTFIEVDDLRAALVAQGMPLTAAALCEVYDRIDGRETDIAPRSALILNEWTNAGFITNDAIRGIIRDMVQ